LGVKGIEKKMLISSALLPVLAALGITLERRLSEQIDGRFLPTRFASIMQSVMNLEKRHAEA
jgi:hypothetical protein